MPTPTIAPTVLAGQAAVGFDPSFISGFLISVLNVSWWFWIILAVVLVTYLYIKVNQKIS